MGIVSLLPSPARKMLSDNTQVSMQNEEQSTGELTWIYAKETALKTRWEGEDKTKLKET